MLKASSRAGGDARASNLVALVRLLQLASPALPIGGYSYSQGLEWLIETREVHDARSTRRWIDDVLQCVIAEGDAAVLSRLCDARAAGNASRFAEWSGWYRASRESRELRAETEQMGASLVQLVADVGLLDETSASFARGITPVPLPAAYAIAAHALEIRSDAAIAAYVMSWLENQVLVAIKVLPMGQVAGQRLLFELAGGIPDVVARARALPDDDVTSFAPGFARASMRHETQYSRLFRS